MQQRPVEELLPWLYLKGVSTGDFSEALAALLGADAPGLSASTIVRLKKTWEDDFADWSKRSLAGKNPTRADTRLGMDQTLACHSQFRNPVVIRGARSSF